MNMARYEQETIIGFNEEEKTAGIYTHNKMLRQKLAALRGRIGPLVILAGQIFAD